MWKSQVPSLRLCLPSYFFNPQLTFLRPQKLTSLFILNILLGSIGHGGRQWKHVWSFIPLPFSINTSSAKSSSSQKALPGYYIRTKEFWCEEFSGHFLLFYFSISWAVVRHERLSARAPSSLCSLWEMKLKSLEGSILDWGGVGLEGRGRGVVGPLWTCKDVNQCIAKGFWRPCLICLSLTYTFTKAQGGGNH